MTLLLTILIAAGLHTDRLQQVPAPDQILLVQQRACRQFQPATAEPGATGAEERQELRAALERFVAQHPGEVIDIRSGSRI